MPKSIFKLLAVLALLAAGAAALHARLGTGVALHLEHAECAACHLAGKDVTAAQAGMLTASQEVLCGKCHLAAIQVSHPSGLQPARTPPAAYPLDWKGDHPIGMSYRKALAYGGYRPLRTVERKLLLPDGRVSCISCHGGYQKEHGKLLVANAGSALCYQCHDL